MSTSQRPAHGASSRSKATAAKRKARHRRRVAIVSVSCCLLVLIGSGLIWGGLYINKLLSQVQVQEFSDVPTPGTSEPPKVVEMAASDYAATTVEGISLKGDSSYVTNYMLLGLNENLSDTNIVLSIDTNKKTIQLISLQRDTTVIITRDNGTTFESKFNGSHSIGGIPMHRRTVENNFRLQIDRYISINFNVFVYAVDQLGGVDITLNASEAKFLVKKNKAGTYHLNGTQALAYSRDRSHTTISGARDDYGRTERQRTMLFALFNEAKKKPLTLTTKLINILDRADIVTTIPRDQLVTLVMDGLTKYKDYEQIPRSLCNYQNTQEHWIGKSQAIALKNPVASVLELHEWIYGKPADSTAGTDLIE